MPLGKVDVPGVPGGVGTLCVLGIVEPDELGTLGVQDTPEALDVPDAQGTGRIAGAAGALGSCARVGGSAKKERAGTATGG